MRITENSVLVQADGKIAYMRSFPDPERPGNNKAKIREIFDPVSEQVVEATPMIIGDCSGVIAFVRAFNDLKTKSRSGYDQYFNNYGPSNPESPTALTNQGVLKNIVVFLNVLHERANNGDKESATALAIISEYNTVAKQQIINREKAELLRRVSEVFTADEIAQATHGINPPAASVNITEDIDKESATALTIRRVSEVFPADVNITEDIEEETVSVD